jgi:hypothetical protein
LGNHRPYAYVLVQRDHNDESLLLEVAPSPGESGAGTTAVTDFDYNSIYWGIGSTGALSDRLVYGVELTAETGRTLSRNPAFTDNNGINEQTRDDINAYAANLQLDYVLADPHNTRVSGSFIYASGDEDRRHTTDTSNGNAPNTDDNAFNAFGLLNTGLAYSPNVSNLLLARAGISTFPFTSGEWLKRMQVGVDGFGFWKASGSGGLEEASTDSRYVGCESDIYLNWQLTSDLTVSVRYGVFFPESGLVADDDERHAFFASITIGL